GCSRRYFPAAANTRFLSNAATLKGSGRGNAVAATSPNAALQKSLRWSIARIKPALDSVRQVEYGFTSRNEITNEKRKNSVLDGSSCSFFFFAWIQRALRIQRRYRLFEV